LYFISSFINEAVTNSDVSETRKNAASILSTVAVSLGSNNFGIFESSGVGLTSSNIGEVYENYRFSVCLGMMAVSFVIFLVIGLYLDNVLPSAYGLRKPWYFLF
jgi:ATP-binding cassette subfamily A (ABC1) protein 3